MLDCYVSSAKLKINDMINGWKDVYGNCIYRSGRILSLNSDSVRILITVDLKKPYEEIVPVNSMFLVNSATLEFQHRYKNQAQQIIAALYNRMEYYEIGEHDNWNEWLCDDPYKMAEICKYNKIDIVGYCSDIPIKRNYEGDILDVGICFEYKNGNKAWCHYSSKRLRKFRNTWNFMRKVEDVDL